MKNPFAPQQDPNSYFNLNKRMLQKVQEAQVNDQILGILQKAYESALDEENVVLSRPERNRLFSQIMQLIFEDLLKNHGDKSTSS
ncbi:MAG: hypothetical protein ABI904_17995 [Chloroflexota bacterium]